MDFKKDVDEVTQVIRTFANKQLRERFPYMKHEAMEHMLDNAAENLAEGITAQEAKMQSSLSFMSLPPELRNEIYKLALQAEDGIPLRRSREDPAPSTLPSLLRVSRQVHAEARSIWYGDNEFIIKHDAAIRRTQWGESSRRQAPFVALTPESTRNLLRTLTKAKAPIRMVKIDLGFRPKPTSTMINILSRVRLDWNEQPTVHRALLKAFGLLHAGLRVKSFCVVCHLDKYQPQDTSKDFYEAVGIWKDQAYSDKVIEDLIKKEQRMQLA